ncbi:MAG: hypothetical protein ACRYG7_24505 [Janthinobacterium lividum]
MKKIVLFLALAAATTATAQTAPAAPLPAARPTPAGYAEQLGATIQGVIQTDDAAQLQALAAKLERAAAVAPADWLPRYYQAYALVVSTLQSKESAGAKDALLDRAEAALAQAHQLHGDESELLTLQVYVYQARLRLEPRTRAEQYLTRIDEAVAQAEGLNPSNPRPYLLAANNVYFTPAMYGGGPKAARPLYEQAKAKFAAFRPASALAPNWGESQVLGRLRQYEVTAAAAGN